MNFLRSLPVVSFFIAAGLFLIHAYIIEYLMHTKINSEIIPLMEEFSKFIALSINGYVGVFWTAIFGFEEALAYILKYKTRSGLSHMIIIRATAFIFHFILLAIQYYGFVNYRRTGQYKWVIWYFFMAVMFHYMWNHGLALLTLYYVVEPVLNIFSISLM